MIKELVGAVPKQDTYLFKGIKVKKLVDKVLVLLTETDKDISNSKVPNNIKVLVDGVDILLEITTPDAEIIEKEMLIVFKEKVYNSTIERKNEIRKAIADYIIGSRNYLTSEGRMIVDKMYDIEVKSYFDKGFKRLRGIAYEELKAKRQPLLEDKHVNIGNHGLNISVHTVFKCEAETSVDEAFRGIISYVQEFKTRNKKLYETLDKIYDVYRAKIVETKPDTKNITVEAVLADSIEEELKKDIAEVERIEAEYKADEEKNLAHNLKLAEDCKAAIDGKIKESLQERTLQMDIAEEKENTLIEYESVADFVVKAIKWKVTKENQLFTVKGRFASRGKIKDMTLFNPYMNEIRFPELIIAKVDASYNVGYDDEKKRYSSKGLTFFIELLENVDKVNIYAAIGIWKNMEEADFTAMKPYFDENIKVVKEIMVN
jgi:hypothetical protein